MQLLLHHPSVVPAQMAWHWSEGVQVPATATAKRRSSTTGMLTLRSPPTATGRTVHHHYSSRMSCELARSLPVAIPLHAGSVSLEAIIGLRIKMVV